MLFVHLNTAEMKQLHKKVVIRIFFEQRNSITKHFPYSKTREITLHIDCMNLVKRYQN